MENVVDVRVVDVGYAGVGIGRSTVLRDWSPTGAFIGFPEPMPTGTPLRLTGEGIQQAARVVEAIESADPAVAGMRVRFVGGSEGARPAQAAPVPEAQPKPVAAAPAPEPDPKPTPVAASEVPAETMGAPGSTPVGDGEAGSSAGSGKRRRRRR